MNLPDAHRNCPDGSTAALRACKGCGCDISQRRGNARFCASCGEVRQKLWHKTHPLVSAELARHIDAIERAAGIVRTLGNEELSGQLQRAANIMRGEA